MKINTRHMARECVVQALYSWQLSGNDCIEIQTEVLLERDIKQIDLRFFKDLFSAIIAIAPQLDEEMSPYLSRKLEELGQVERAILRLAVYELSRRMDVPYKVVINEAIELSKTFGAQDSHKFINGVLDKMRPVLRVKS